MIWIKVGFSALLIGVLLWFADLRAAVEAFTQVAIAYFLLALLIKSLGLVIRAYKWQVLLRAHGVYAPLMALANYTYISMFFNSFFLGSLGGDAFRTYRASALSQSVANAASSVVMERVVGFFAALVLVSAVGTAAALLHVGSASTELLFHVLAASGLAVALLAVAVCAACLPIPAPRLLHRFPRVHNIVQNVIRSFRIYGANRRILVHACGLSCLQHLVQGATVYAYVRATHGTVALFDVVFVSLCVGIIVMLPVSINGIGLQEVSLAYYLTSVGVSEPNALVVVVLARVSMLIFASIGALLFLVQRQSTRSRLAERGHLPSDALL